MNRFSNYINEIVNKLDCTEIEKQDLKDEFLDHLNSLKIEYRSKGKSEQEAIALAIKEFGEEKTICFEMNKSISKLSKLLKKVFNVTWWLYIAVVVWILLLSQQRIVMNRGHKDFSLIPFKQIWKYITGYNRYNFDIWFLNLFGNMIIFVPFGFLLPFIFNKGKTIRSNLLFTFIFSFSIEMMQYIFSFGVFDIDDIILNLIGSMAGFSIYKLFLVVLKKSKKEYLILE